MYRNVLLTDKEIALLKRVVGDTLHEKIIPEARNLTVILNRLRQINPLKTNNQFFNYGKQGSNGQTIKTIRSEWASGPQNDKIMLKTEQYHLDKNKRINILITKFTSGEFYFSVVDNQNDSDVESGCSVEELKGLADFIYKTIGEKK